MPIRKRDAPSGKNGVLLGSEWSAAQVATLRRGIDEFREALELHYPTPFDRGVRIRRCAPRTTSVMIDYETQPLTHQGR